MIRPRTNNGIINKIGVLARKSVIFVGCGLLVQGCYFFKERSLGESVDANSVLGQPLGARAGSADPVALAAIYGTTSSQPPAGVRPDPDTLVRHLLLQFRPQSMTVARETGRVEQYRLLLGGANEDFSVTPQVSYDATSLLAKLKVAQEVCRGLVAPEQDLHPGWATILPAPPSDVETNLRFLLQRLSGVPSASIPVAKLTRLNQILDSYRGSEEVALSHYIGPCSAVVVDAESLLL